MRRYDAAPLSAGQPLALGEGVVWDDESDRLWWVDVLAGDVWSGVYDGERLSRVESVHVDDTVGCLVPADDAGVAIAGERRLFAMSADGGVQPLAALPIDAHQRLNDGACDAAGRLLVGTASLAPSKAGNRLLQVDPSGDSRPLRDDVGLANGLAWSPDQSTLYFVDSNPGVVWRCDYDVESGAASGWRELFRVEGGTPDGMTVDAAGNLWVAIWGAGEVRQLSPTGEAISVVSVPALHTTCVAFAGPALRSLVITTARHGLSPDDLARHPDSGRLFHIEVETAGVPTHRWTGPTRAAQPPAPAER